MLGDAVEGEGDEDVEEELRGIVGEGRSRSFDSPLTWRCRAGKITLNRRMRSVPGEGLRRAFKRLE